MNWTHLTPLFIPYTHTRAYLITYTHTHIHTYVHTTHTYTNTHTHIYTISLSLSPPLYLYLYLLNHLAISLSPAEEIKKKRNILPRPSQNAPARFPPAIPVPHPRGRGKQERIEKRTNKGEEDRRRGRRSEEEEVGRNKKKEEERKGQIKGKQLPEHNLASAHCCCYCYRP